MQGGVSDNSGISLFLDVTEREVERFSVNTKAKKSVKISPREEQTITFPLLETSEYEVSSDQDRNIGSYPPPLRLNKYTEINKQLENSKEIHRQLQVDVSHQRCNERHVLIILCIPANIQNDEPSFLLFYCKSLFLHHFMCFNAELSHRFDWPEKIKSNDVKDGSYLALF